MYRFRYALANGSADRQRSGRRRRGSVQDMNGTRIAHDHEVIHQFSILRKRLRPDPVLRFNQIVFPDFGY